MNFIHILIILFSVSLNTFAQLFLKKGADACIAGRSINVETFILCATNVYFWLGFLCYAISVLSWIFVLSKMNVSLAYPFLSFGIILSIVLAKIVFNEPITIQKILCMFFISIGLLILSLK